MKRLKAAVLSLLFFLAALLPFGATLPVSARAAAEQPAYGIYAQPARKAAPSMPAEVIFERSADAVFMIETFDSRGESIRTGSGFFISENGLAVTCLHVLDNAFDATITLHNGDVYPVKGVHSASVEFNLAVFSIDSDETEWPFLTIADSDLIETGNAVYVIGSPLEYINTMTAGIISTTQRDADDSSFIQFTAPISFGSGGSPLLNARGEVIGVASSSYSYGQHMNLAVPINLLIAMPPGECTPLSST